MGSGLEHTALEESPDHPFSKSPSSQLLASIGFPSCYACGLCYRKVFHLNMCSTPVYCKLLVSSSLNALSLSPRGQ